MPTFRDLLSPDRWRRRVQAGDRGNRWRRIRGFHARGRWLCSPSALPREARFERRGGGEEPLPAVAYLQLPKPRVSPAEVGGGLAGVKSSLLQLDYLWH